MEEVKQETEAASEWPWFLKKPQRPKKFKPRRRSREYKKPISRREIERLRKRTEQSIKAATAANRFAKKKWIGVPNGMTVAEADAAWAVAREKTEKIFNHMVELGLVDPINPDDCEKVVVKDDRGRDVEVVIPETDEAKAALALKESVLIFMSPYADLREKNQAIATTLAYTKQKPSQKQSLALEKPEDFLAMLASMDGSKSNASSE